MPLHGEARPAQIFGGLPPSFIENAGQLDSSVRFQVRGAGHAVDFRPQGVVFRGPRSVVELRFPGADPAARLEGLQTLPGTVNFYLGNDPSRWHTGVPTYGSIAYRDLYPGVDLVFLGSAGGLKSELRVAAGASPAPIRLRYSGARELRLRADGALVIETVGGEILEEPPLVYQEIAGRRIEVEARYRLLGDGRVGFGLGTYRRSHALVIDPALVFSTYLGGIERDEGWDIAVDADGYLYVAGSTASDGFPTASPLQPAYGGGESDVFVAKIEPDGSALVFSSYVGGSAGDWGTAIALDAPGNVYLTGYTASQDFPVANAIQPTYGGGQYDAFAAKFGSDGASVSYSTYLGGSGTATDPDQGLDIAVDDAGNAYVVGTTASDDFPTMFPVQATYQDGGSDAFIAKINTSGSGLVFSTYLGGSGIDQAYGVDVDTARSVHVAGLTRSFDFPRVAAMQGVKAGGNDLFVAKFNPSGASLTFSTYLGGSAGDWANAIAVDADGNIHLTGVTGSFDFPTQDPIQPSIRGGTFDAFVTALDAAGANLVYSTFFGGFGDDHAEDIAVGADGRITIAGYAPASGFPPVVCPAQTLYGGGAHDAFVVRLEAGATEVVFSSFLGGSAEDWGTSIAVDDAGNTYLAGYTASDDFPTLLPIQPARRGGRDAFVAKIDAQSVPAPPAGGVLTVTRDTSEAVGCELNWTGIQDAAAYNVYRGSQPALSSDYDHTCLVDGIPALRAADPEGPAPGALLFYYLVSGENACGEGGLGTDSAGADRPNPDPCP